MRCNNCNKEFDSYLFRYNGTLTCPHCFEEVDPSGVALEITKENDEIFTLSEASFFKGLIDNNYDQVESGIKLCREAMSLGHPKAYYRMGYYIEKNFVNGYKGDIYKAMSAFEHYSVALFNQADIPSEFSKKYSSQTLKLNAATSLAQVVVDNPELSKINKKYSLEFVLERIKSAVPSFAKPASSGARILPAYEKIYNTLYEVDASMNNVLSGIYTLRSSQLKQLINKGSADDPLFKKLISSKNLTMKYRMEGNPDYIKLQSSEDFDDCNNACDSNLSGIFHFAFFNNNPKLIYVKQAQLADVKKKLFDNEANLDSIGSKAGDNGINIYEDDIKFFMGKSKNAEKGLTDLVNEFDA